MILAFVPFDEIFRWVAQGWLISADLSLCHHGKYSVIMVKT